MEKEREGKVFNFFSKTSPLTYKKKRLPAEVRAFSASVSTYTLLGLSNNDTNSWARRLAFRIKTQYGL